MELRLRASRSESAVDEAVQGVGEGVEELADEAVEVSGLGDKESGVSFEGELEEESATLSTTASGISDITSDARSEATSEETSETAGRRGGLLERLLALDAAPPPPPPHSAAPAGISRAVDSRFGYGHTGGSRPDPALMPPSQGLIHQILSAHSAAAGTAGGGVGPVGPVGPAGPALPSGPVDRRRLQKSASLTPDGGRRHSRAHPRLTRSVTLQEGGGVGGGGVGGGGGGGGVSPRPAPARESGNAPAKESGNARVGRYIRSLLQRISEVPDQ